MRALEFIYDDDRGSAGPADVNALRDLLGSDEADQATAALKYRGQIILDNRSGGGYHITGEGRTAVEEMRARQTDRAYRRSECRQRLLEWVDAQTEVDSSGSWVSQDQFDDSLDLVPFSDNERFAAVGFLADNRLIDSLPGGLCQHTLIWITDRGQQAVDEGGIEAFLAKGIPGSSTTTNYHLSGTGNTYAVATASGAVAHANVTNFNLDHARLLAAAVRAVEGDLALDDQARSALAEIETSGDDKEKASKATKMLHTALMATTTGALGQVFGVLGASALGIPM